MKMKVRANYISQRIVQSKKDATKKYIYITFSDGHGLIELQSDRPIEIPLFIECDLVVDILQGQYPRYNLDDLKVTK